jgi:hypothetical protein
MNTGHLSTVDLERALRVLERESGVTLRFGFSALRSALDVLPDPPSAIRCACGTGLTLCATCAVADWQAQP